MWTKGKIWKADKKKTVRNLHWAKVDGKVTVTYFRSGNFATEQQIPIMITFFLSEVDFFMHKSLREDNTNLYQFFKYTKKHL